MLTTYRGSCHCQRVSFSVLAPQQLEIDRCNCSICTKSGFLHLIVPKNKFKLEQGEEYLRTYRFGTHVAQHTFCQFCGIKPFYIPRSNPDGVSINFCCLEPRPINFVISEFDGQNWEQNAAKLAHKSQET